MIRAQKIILNINSIFIFEWNQNFIHNESTKPTVTNSVVYHNISLSIIFTLQLKKQYLHIAISTLHNSGSSSTICLLQICQRHLCACGTLGAPCVRAIIILIPLVLLIYLYDGLFLVLVRFRASFWRFIISPLICFVSRNYYAS